MEGTTPARGAQPGELRLSDAERSQMVDYLREQAGEGRLSLFELEERIDVVYRAKVRSDLAPVTEGLPVPDRPRPPAVVEPTDCDTTFGIHLRVYCCVIAFLVLIYLVTDAGGYFWPIWPAMGWGLGVALHGVTRNR